MSNPKGSTTNSSRFTARRGMAAIGSPIKSQIFRSARYSTGRTSRKGERNRHPAARGSASPHYPTPARRDSQILPRRYWIFSSLLKRLASVVMALMVGPSGRPRLERGG
jgi:hypothetical protein